ncbi:TetR/AcrR family transcriptional regulator [Shimia biformata]|uniref:TetR/AcrR family transcriptional regulator n=1 Tax=Shimia biformata TaxID=1294299 RepID=UPI00194DB3C0|nr:TetR/AcrR family transcriptional regulator [Shimia biformata]
MTAHAPRSHYVEIATAGFSDHGFHGLSLAALAKMAGVSKQAFLHHFRSKEGLYAEVLTDLSNRLLARLEGFSHLPPAERLAGYLEATFLDQTGNPQDARLVVRALLDSPGDAALYPLQPYLDALMAQARDIPAWRDATEADLFAALYQLIAITQYVAISTATVTGMYGAATQEAVAIAHRARFKRQLAAFLQGA